MPSTVISKIQYDAASSSLIITYQSGQRYCYLSVPEKTYKELRASMVKGRYLRFHVIGKFEYRKLPDAESEL